jgi:hypothetical protein
MPKRLMSRAPDGPYEEVAFQRRQIELSLEIESSGGPSVIWSY